MEEKVKNNMLMVLEEYKLRVPTAETKTMPEGLRREVRGFVNDYIGSYRKQLHVVRNLKKNEFVKKHEVELRKIILGEGSIKMLIAEYDKHFDLFREAYLRVRKDERLTINQIYEFDKGESRKRVEVSSDWVSGEIDRKFESLYGDGFAEFDSVLKKFESKIEEAVLFATITEVYNLIKQYAKFDTYLKKISEIKVK